MAMSVCPICGHRNPEGASLCALCGALLRAAPRSANSGGAFAAEDPLAGLEGLLPTPSDADRGVGAKPGPSSEPGEDERDAAALLQRIAAGPAPMGPGQQEPPPPWRKGPSAGMRRFLYLLVLLAALMPLLAPGLGTEIHPRPEVLALAQEMQGIPAEGCVLVVFDYSPGFGGELNSLAERVLADLAGRGVTLAALATRPEGVGLARQIVGRATSGTPDYTYGVDYVILGYLPGEESGLRLLAQDLATILPHDDVLQLPLARLPAMQGIASLDDLAAMLLLTDDATSARRWIEQVGTRTETPTYALATARVEPVLAPFAQSGQLAALVAGAYGALEYPTELAFEPAGLSARSEGYLALGGVFVLTAILANVKRRPKG